MTQFTLGASPKGTPNAIISDRDWDDYSVGRDTVQAHLAALEGASSEKSAAGAAR